MVSWRALSNRVRAEIGELVPSFKTTDRQILIFLSEAVSQLQEKTSAVKRTATITLDPNSTDGGYTLALDVMHIIGMQYLATGSTVPSDTRNLSPDRLAQLKRGAGRYPQVNTVFQPVDGDMHWTHDLGKIFVFPFSGITGTLLLRYVPHIVPYTVEDTDEWASFGETPTAQMILKGPPQEMYSAISGITAYAKAKALDMLRDESPFFTRLYAQLMSEWQQAERLVLRSQTSQTKRSIMPVRNSPVR